MFLHNFKYSLKTLLGKKSLLFWTFLFPILLGTFFKMAFSNIEKNETFQPFDIAVVNNDSFQQNKMFQQTFKELGDSKNKNQVFNIKYTSIEEAENLLKNKKISGYLRIEEDDIKVVVSTNGTNETMLKNVVDEISQTGKIYANLSEEEFKKTNNHQQVMITVQNIIDTSEVKVNDITSNHLSYTMIEFYTLIAMACLYGGMLGKTAIDQNLANMSSKGKRVSVSPMNRGKAIVSSVLASYLVSFTGVLLLLVYTIFVLQVDYGDQLLSIICLCMTGSLAGVTLGMAIGTIFKTNDNMKDGIIISATMLGCFLSGMMGITMKYIIDKNIPIMNRINPASMITDGFYSLYYYDALDRYFFNIISLLLFSSLMMILAFISLRRQKYDSI